MGYVRVLGLLVAVAAIGCVNDTAVECGPGTVEVQGVCSVPQATFAGHCGFGTELAATLQCVPALPETSCDETATPKQDERGYTICDCTEANQ